MIKTRCVSNNGYKELTIGAEYFFNDFTAKNPFTNNIFGGLHVLVDGKYVYVGLYPRKLFAIVD